MKTRCIAVLGFVRAGAMFLNFPLRQCAAQEAQENIWSDDKPQGRARKIALTDKVVERFLRELAKTDPARAEEFKRLRQTEPEQFKNEIRRLLHERSAQKKRLRGVGRKAQEPRSAGERPLMRGGEQRGPDRMMRMRQKYDEYLKWLSKSHPAEAEELAASKKNNPDLYFRKVTLSFKRYGRIFEESERNPELAEILQQDLELKDRRNDLLREISNAREKEQKDALVKELEEVISQRFDLIVRRKEIEYEKLLDRLEKLKRQVEESKAQVEQWQDVEFKGKNVKARIKELLGRTETFKWE